MIRGKRKRLARIRLTDDVPGWRNGRRCGLKIRCPKGRAGSTPALGTIPFPNVFHDFHQLSPGNDLNPKSEDGAKMVTLFLTNLPLELDHRASRFGKSVDCIFQRLGCASCVCARDALDRVTQ